MDQLEPRCRGLAVFPRNLEANRQLEINIYIYYIHLYSIYRLHHHGKVVEKTEYKNLSASHLLIYKLFSSDMHGIGESKLACSIHAA